jgi:hypothetical protein
VFLAYEILKTNEDISHLRVGVLPQASFRLTTVEGDIPSTESKPSAPPTVVAPAQWREQFEHKSHFLSWMNTCFIRAHVNHTKDGMFYSC